MRNTDARMLLSNRPIKIATLFSVLGELFILVVWGLLLHPEGSLLNKFLWAVVFCGVGMGATLGALIQVFVVGRFEGNAAVLVTTLLSVGLLGIACNILCLNLDSHFDYFGGIGDPVLFVAGGIILSAVGGASAGWLLFSAKGQKVMDSWGF